MFFLRQFENNKMLLLGQIILQILLQDLRTSSFIKWINTNTKLEETLFQCAVLSIAGTQYIFSTTDKNSEEDSLDFKGVALTSSFGRIVIICDTSS